jgi:hypothetical protein
MIPSLLLMLFLHNPSKIIGAIPGPSTTVMLLLMLILERKWQVGQNRQNRGRREQDIRASRIQVGRTL